MYVRVRAYACVCARVEWIGLAGIVTTRRERAVSEAVAAAAAAAKLDEVGEAPMAEGRQLSGRGVVNRVNALRSETMRHY